MLVLLIVPLGEEDDLSSGGGGLEHALHVNYNRDSTLPVAAHIKSSDGMKSLTDIQQLGYLPGPCAVEFFHLRI
jgi:hypothetical protein